MPALQVKEFPDDLYAQLRTCAAEEHRSISQQALAIIQQYLDARSVLLGNADKVRIAADAAMANSFPRVEDVADREACIARKRGIINRIAELPAFTLPEEHESVSDMVAAAREQRW